MVRIIPILIGIFLFSGSLYAQEPDTASKANIALYKKVAPAVVSVQGGGQTGSGVVINPSGIILTSPTACGSSSSSAKPKMRSTQ